MYFTYIYVFFLVPTHFPSIYSVWFTIFSFSTSSRTHHTLFFYTSPLQFFPSRFPLLLLIFLFSSLSLLSFLSMCLLFFSLNSMYLATYFLLSLSHSLTFLPSSYSYLFLYPLEIFSFPIALYLSLSFSLESRYISTTNYGIIIFPSLSFN